MKKTLKIILAITMFSFLSLFNGCEDLADIPLNIPIEVEFSLNGSESSAYESVSFCLNQYSEWEDNQDKINSVKFISAGYWTVSFSPSALMGTINASLKDNNGITLFSFTLPDVSPGDYIDNPYKIELTQAEIDYFNDYLNNLQEDPSCSNPTFTAEISVTNITGGTPYTINGKVEMVLEATVSVD